MEIHGNDIIVDNFRHDFSIQDVINVVKEFWKDLVTEDDGTESGIFIYENDAAMKAWDKEGWSEVNDKTMIYVLWADRGFTIVIDDNKENLPIAKSIEKLVQI